MIATNDDWSWWFGDSDDWNWDDDRGGTNNHG